MAAYVIADVIPHTTLPEYKNLMQEYSLAAAKTIKQYKGEMVAKAPIETLCGPETKAIKVIITFATTVHAREWYSSKEYQALIPLRDKAMNCYFQLVEST